MQPLVFGKYQLLELIAVGGMAEVFRAKSFGVEGFEKTVVIKRILPHLARDQKFIEMFINEAKIAARLSHANIVQIFDLGVERASRAQDAGAAGAAADAAAAGFAPTLGVGSEGGDAYFIAMEYVSGPDLASLIRRSAKLSLEVPIEIAVFVTAQVARALDHAHRARDAHGRALGIVHRDVSPHNILVSRDGEVKLTDFGIVKATGLLGDSEAGVLKGKYAYMAPEQVRAGPIDQRADLFALGIVLWETCTARRLFRGATSTETLKAVTRAQVPRVSSLRNDAPGGLDDILARTLQADPQQRYQTAADLHRDLTALLYTMGRRVGELDLAAFLARLYGPSHRPDPNKLDRTAIDRAFDGLESMPSPPGAGGAGGSGDAARAGGGGGGGRAGDVGAQGGALSGGGPPGEGELSFSSDSDGARVPSAGDSAAEGSDAGPPPTALASVPIAGGTAVASRAKVAAAAAASVPADVSPAPARESGRDAQAVALVARVVAGPPPTVQEIERARAEVSRFHGWFAEGAGAGELVALFGWPQAGPFEVERALRASTRIAGEGAATAGAGATRWSVGVVRGPLGADRNGEVSPASLRELARAAGAFAEMAAEVGRGRGGVVVAQDQVAALGERWFRTEPLPAELSGEESGASSAAAGGAGAGEGAAGDASRAAAGTVDPDAAAMGDTAPQLARAARVLGLRSGAGDAVPVHDRTPFVGRGAAMRALARRLQRAGEGSGQVVALVGPAGIGKSRILAEFRASLRPSAAAGPGGRVGARVGVQAPSGAFPSVVGVAGVVAAPAAAGTPSTHRVHPPATAGAPPAVASQRPDGATAGAPPAVASQRPDGAAAGAPPAVISQRPDGAAAGAPPGGAFQSPDGAAAAAGRATPSASTQAPEADTGLAAGWFEARCVPTIAEQPFRPVRDLVAAIAGVEAAATPLETFAALDRLRPLGLRDRDVAALAGLFGDAVGALAPPTPPGRPAVLELLGALTRVAGGLTRERPVVLVLEDFQWADATTRDLCELLLDALTTRRVLTVISARPDPGYDVGLALRGSFKVLTVAPMDEGETLALARGFLGVRRLPSALGRHLVAQGQGNPFFVEELLEALLERRALELHGGEALLREPLEGAGVPSSLRGLFAARLRGLSAEARRLATYAAAIGPRFHLDLLRAATRTSVRRAAAVLDELVRRGVMELVGMGSALQYGFTHQLAREVLYEDLPAEERVRMHGEIAARVEAASFRGGAREAPLELAEFLAAHYSRGPEPLRAARFLEAAGGHYARQRDTGRSLDRYLRALALVGSEPSLGAQERAKRVVHLCEALTTSGAAERDLPRVLDALERYRALWPDAGEPAAQARTLERLAALHAESGDAAQAERLLDEALVCAASAPGVGGELPARLHAARGGLMLSRGETDRALADLGQARELAEAGGQPAAIAAARVALARAYALAGDFGRAMEQLAAAEALARQVGGALHADFLLEQAHLLFWRGDHAGALRSDLAALDLSRAEGFGPKLALAAHRAGVDALFLDDYGRAFSYFGLSQDVAEEHGLTVLGALNRAFLAYLEIAAGRGEEAVGEIEHALEVVTARHQRDHEARLRQLLARAHALRGHADAARQETRRALRVAHAIGHGPLTAELERQVEQLGTAPDAPP
ncbi:MAG TPA: protein kinase [Myxococcota bacterium]|nr:protein kinase [Myxococcota bacterium]